MPDLPKVRIYSDGACSGNPGPGGWGAVLLFEDRREELKGCETPTTNNRMELRASIQALSHLKGPHKVELVTDSSYVCNAFRQDWISNWEANGWMNYQKKPVKNKDLWLELIALTKTHSILWLWVKGHNQNAENERADQLAVEAKETLMG